MLRRLLCVVSRNLTANSLAPGCYHCTRQYSSDTKSIESLFSSISVPEDSNIVSNSETYEEIPEAEVPSPSLPGHRIRGILVPNLDTHSSLVAGQKYNEIPIANIRAAWQNTFVTVTDHTGGKKYSRKSGGGEGYKNSKKRTNVAAQAAGLAAGQEVRSKGVTHVRVAIRGMGKGRLAACKGLEMAGIEIVSLTDVSKVNWGAQKPRKKRRI